MAPPKPAKPTTVREFEQGFEPALTREDDRTKLNGAIKRIANAETLAKCLDAYCRKFDPANPPKKKDAAIRARVIGYALLIRAAELVGPLNALQAQLAALDALPAPKDDSDQKQLAIWTRRWKHLEENERNLVRQQITKTLKDAAKARPSSLLPYLIERCRTDRDIAAPTLEQLLDFDPGSAAQAAEFSQWFQACYKPWGAWHNLKNRPPLDENIATVDAAFKAFRTRLDGAIKTPVDFYRILKYVRDLKPENDVWGFKHEIYLEVVAKGLQMSLAEWEIESAYSSRAFVGDDYDFLLRGVGFGKSRLLLRLRLEPMSKGPGEILKESSQRRRLVIAGAYRSLDFLDEIELQQLAQKIDEGWRKDPFEIAKRFILLQSGRDVFKDRVWINQQVENGFTVVWIDYARDGNRWAYIEAHAIPGVIYKGNHSALAALNEQALYKALAKNAAALTAFLLAYLEVLGWAADIATAGISGGLRRVIWEFAKERIKEKMLEKGMTSLGIDNPWLQTAAGFGVNFIKLPKTKPTVHAEFQAAHPNKPISKKPNGAEDAAQARAGAIADRTAAPAPALDQLGAPPPRGTLEVADPAPRPVSGIDEAAGSRGGRSISGDERAPVTNLEDVRKRKAAKQKHAVADPEPSPAAEPNEAAARAHSQALDRRTEDTGQKPITEAEDKALEAAGISQMRKQDAQMAGAQARQQIAAAESATAVRASSGGGDGKSATVGHAKPAQGGGRGSSRPTTASRGTPAQTAAGTALRGLHVPLSPGRKPNPRRAERLRKAENVKNWTDLPGTDRTSLGKAYNYIVQTVVRAIASGGRATVHHYPSVTSSFIKKSAKNGGRVIITEGRLPSGRRFDIAEIDFSKRPVTVEIVDLTSMKEGPHSSKTTDYAEEFGELTGYQVNAYEARYVNDDKLSDELVFVKVSK